MQRAATSSTILPGTRAYGLDDEFMLAKSSDSLALTVNQSSLGVDAVVSWQRLY